MKQPATASVAVDKAKHGHFVVVRAPYGLALFAPDIGFIDLDSAAADTKGRKVAFAHGFTNAVRQEPSGLVRDLQHPVELVSTDALLAAGEQEHGLQHLVKWDAA